VRIRTIHPSNANLSIKEDLAHENLVVFVLSCFGEGEPTDNAKEFYQWITKQDPKKLHLNTRFCVFGLGNSTYGGARYQAVSRTIDRRLEELGAHRVCERGEGDDSKGIEDAFDSWKDNLFPTLEKTLVFDSNHHDHDTEEEEQHGIIYQLS